MKDDYLWDRTGEPDPEIQQLEQVLGTLRYQAKPLELAAQVRIARPGTFSPRLAIAAAVAMVLVGGAWWLLLHRKSAPVGLESTSNPPAAEKLKPKPDNVATPAQDDVVARLPNNLALENQPKRPGVNQNVMARNKQFRTFRATESARQRAEAEAARDQLLLALRVASAKLSLAQKKAQGGYPGSLIRNQHKIG
jgi:hypothetical protein